jgi:hypothetical protein
MLITEIKKLPRLRQGSLYKQLVLKLSWSGIDNGIYPHPG